jgi:hypothetical protein
MRRKRPTSSLDRRMAIAEGMIDQITPILAGGDAGMIAYVLANLVATYIAGHRTSSGDPDHLRDHQARVLDGWLKMLVAIIPLQNDLMSQRLKAGDPEVIIQDLAESLTRDPTQH